MVLLLIPKSRLACFIFRNSSGLIFLQVGVQNLDGIGIALFYFSLSCQRFIASAVAGVRAVSRPRRPCGKLFLKCSQILVTSMLELIICLILCPIVSYSRQIKSEIGFYFSWYNYGTKKDKPSANKSK